MEKASLPSLKKQSSILSNTSSLSLSIVSAGRTKKRKTTFLSSKSNKNKNTNRGKDNGMKSFQRGVSLSHVVFHQNTSNKNNNSTTSVQNKVENRGMSQADRALSIPKRGISSLKSGKRKRVTGGGLWSKVSQNRFRSH